MATRLLTGTLLCCSAFNLSAQQIANGDFESWTDVVLFENIDVWTNGNFQIPGMVTTTKVPGTVGQFAAHLETVAVGPDTTFGFILHGNFVNDIPTEGVPFTTEIDAMEGWYRYALMPNDSALIYLLVWNGGVIVDSVIQMIGGAQAQWTAFSFPVNGGVPIQPDSVVVAVTSSSPFALAGMTPGSWIEVDGLQLTSTNVPNPDLLPNNDMEDWTDVGTEEPDNWSTFNTPLATLGIAPVTKSTMAHAGNFSARIETIYLGADTLGGFATYGNSLFVGVPYADTPSLMTAFHQYSPSGVDTAAIGAFFIGNGALLAQAYAVITATTATWTFVGTPITLFSAPDTLYLQISSGKNPGSVLYLDDLAFSGISMGVQPAADPSIAIFPQPASDMLYVSMGSAEWNGAALRITDQLGRVVREERIAISAGQTMPLSMDGLAAGQYVLELLDRERSERRVFVKD